MKVIFLDCDGVINSSPWFIEMYEKYNGQNYRQHVCPEMVKRIADIVKATDAKIVLSSCWRLGFDDNMNPRYCDDPTDNCTLLDKMLKEYNCELNGKTGYADGHRATEIKEYLDSHPEIDSFVIIDDDIEDIVNPEEYITEKNKDVYIEYYGKTIGEYSDEELHKRITGLFGRDVIVQTSFMTGITDELAKEAINKLLKRKKENKENDN